MPTANDPASLDLSGTRGHPIHTRILSIDVRQADSEHLRAKADLLDLRKCGFVPTGTELQISGIIHHMRLDALVHRESAVLTELEPSQPIVAFEASEFTAGESCRDPVYRLRELAGQRVDDGFARKLSRCFGGALGCTHLLTLAHLMASTISRTIESERALRAANRGPREPQEQVFKRSLVLDGFERSEGGDIEVVLQLNDVATAPRGEYTGILSRFLRQCEVRALALIDMETLTLAGLTAEERERTPENLSHASWRSRDAEFAGILGQPALPGLTRALLDRFGDDAALRNVLDTLLNLAPVLIQCLGATAHRIVEKLAENGVVDRPEAGDIKRLEPKGLEMGGFPDSCYMWRSNGPLGPLRHGG